MYNKIFTKILDSSIWLEPTPIRIVWVTLLAAMDEEGFCQFASVANLAHRAVVSIEDAISAVKTLESPDENSSDPDNEGRRIEKVPGGWMVLNAPKYRDLVTRNVAREQTRERVRKYRQRKKDGNADVTQDNGPVTTSEADTHADTETNTSSDCSDRKNPVRASGVKRVQWNADSGWSGIIGDDMDSWRTAYPACAIELQLSRMTEWLRSNPAKARKSNFYRFIVNWLQREQNRGGDIASNSSAKSGHLDPKSITPHNRWT